MVEKHFTIDKNLPGPDQAVSLEPDEFRLLVSEGRKAALALRSLADEVQPAEVGVREMAGHSVVTTRAIRKGHVFEAGDLTTKRPGTGIPAAQLEKGYGAIATVDLETNVVVQRDDVLKMSYA